MPPLEISKQNLMRMAEALPSSLFMPVVFSFPQLFTIRGDLAKTHGTDRFADRDGQGFTLNSRRDYNVLVPDRPFSIIDRTPFLRKEKIERFVLDLSNASPNRGFFRDIAKAAAEAKVLPDASRFNWKDGFYSDDEGARKSKE